MQKWPFTTNPRRASAAAQSGRQWFSPGGSADPACEALVRAGAGRADTLASPIELIWARMSDAERDDFVHSHLLEVWIPSTARAR
jgi:hypothetical protein